MYVVIELQKMSDEQLLYLVETFVDINAAQSKFHTILAAAAISSVPQHSAALLTDQGRTIRFEHYEHGTEEIMEE